MARTGRNTLRDIGARLHGFQTVAEYRRAGAVVLLAALFLRVVWALIIPTLPISDSAAYDILARNLTEYSTYGWTPDRPSAYWPVGTSAIYAVFYKIFGHSYTPIVAFNIVVGVGLVSLTMSLARRFFGEATGLISGMVMALWPSEIMFVTVLNSELPFTLSISAALLFWSSEKLSLTARGVSVGLCLAAAVYLRPVALLLPVVFAISSFIQGRHSVKTIASAALALFVIVGAMAPWSARNTALFGEFVLMSTNFGPTLWMGNNPDSNGQYMPLPDGVAGLNEQERAHILRRRALAYIRAEPGEFVLRTLKKAVIYHAGETIAVHWNKKGIEKTLGTAAMLPAKILTQGYWTLILIFAFGGVIVLCKRNGVVTGLAHPLVLPWLYFAAVHSIILVQDRYHFPAHPFIAILAAVAAIRLVDGLGIKETSRHV